MYAKFRMTNIDTLSDEIESVDLTSYLEKENKLKQQLSLQSIEKYTLSNGDLDAKEIKDEWFQSIKADIFLSHSHKDIETVKKFAAWLENTYDVNVFVDAFMWGDCRQLQLELDQKYSLVEGEENLFHYEKTQEYGAHVNLLLASALTQIIDQTECIIFLDTTNSIDYSQNDSDIPRTNSAWIYHEIQTTKVLRQRIPERRKKIDSLFEHFDEAGQLSYELDALKDFIEIDGTIFNHISSQKKGFRMLDNLYKEVSKLELVD